MSSWILGSRRIPGTVHFSFGAGYIIVFDPIVLALISEYLRRRAPLSSIIRRCSRSVEGLGGSSFEWSDEGIILGTKRRRTAYRSCRVSSSMILCRASLYLFMDACIYYQRFLLRVSSMSIFHQDKECNSRTRTGCVAWR